MLYTTFRLRPVQVYSKQLYCENGKEKPVHVVIGVGEGYLWLVTAYFPSEGIWESDFKTRR